MNAPARTLSASVLPAPGRTLARPPASALRAIAAGVYGSRVNGRVVWGMALCSLAPSGGLDGHGAHLVLRDLRDGVERRDGEVVDVAGAGEVEGAEHHPRRDAVAHHCPA